MSTPAPASSSLVVPFLDLPSESVIYGRSDAMTAVRQKVEKVAMANVPVLVRGESGTGKEMVAKMLHRRSPWSNGPFVKVNCPAIPGTLLESELFGYEKGAFTGAYGMKPGRVEMANRGTLFLDEVAELEPSLQAKLLQVLQDGQFSRIGAQEDKKVEVRVVCATNRHLEDEIEAGTFRQDLFYRINVASIELPPLRDRIQDLPELVSHFLAQYGAQFKRPVRPPSPNLMRMLQKYHWPGNIRELENLMKRYVILGSEEAVSSDLLSREPELAYVPAHISANGSISLKKITRQAVLDLERKVILKVLEANSWNRKRTAHALSISYRALLYKIRQAGLPPKRARSLAAPKDPATASAD